MEQFDTDLLDALAEEQFQTGLAASEAASGEEASESEESAEAAAEKVEEKAAPQVVRREEAEETMPAAEEINIEQLLQPPQISQEQVRQWVGDEEWDSLPPHLQRAIYTTVYNYAVSEQLRHAMGIAFEALEALAERMEKASAADEEADRIVAQLASLADEYDLSEDDVNKVIDLMEKRNIQDPEVAVAFYLQKRPKKATSSSLIPEQVRTPIRSQPAVRQEVPAAPAVPEIREYTLRDAWQETLRRTRRRIGRVL